MNARRGACQIILLDDARIVARATSGVYDLRRDKLAARLIRDEIDSRVKSYSEA